MLGAVALAGCKLAGRRLADSEHGDRHGRDRPLVPDRPGLPSQGRPEEGEARSTRAAAAEAVTRWPHAHSTGTTGPNLDQLKPDYRATTAQVTNGGAPMPAFKSTLTPQQIADVSAYVVDSTGGTAP